MSNLTISELQDQNERLKALVAFLRDELDELINAIDEEVETEEREEN